MKREGLIKGLDAKGGCKDCRIVLSVKYEVVKPRIHKPEKNNSVENDFYLKGMFDYINLNDQKNSSYLKDSAYYITANLSFEALNVPTISQMSEMMRICEYSAKDMNEYAKENRDQKAACLSNQALFMTVCLLSRLLAEAMGDPSIWNSYKNGKKRLNYTPATNLSMKKLQSLVAYMEENNLLMLDANGDENYNEFVTDIAWHLCRMESIGRQRTQFYDDGKEQLNDLMHQIEQEDARLEREESETYSKKNKKKSKSQVPSSAPVLTADLVQAIQTSIVTKGQPGHRFYDESDTKDPYNGLSYLERSLYEKRDQLIAESNDLEVKCCNVLNNLNEEDADALAKTVYYKRDHMGVKKYMAIVAKGMFRAILAGDDIYRLSVGKKVMESFIQQSNMPLPEKMADWKHKRLNTSTVLTDEQKNKYRKIWLDYPRDTLSTVVIDYPEAKPTVQDDVKETAENTVSNAAISKAMLRVERLRKERDDSYQILTGLLQKAANMQSDFSCNAVKNIRSGKNGSKPVQGEGKTLNKNKDDLDPKILDGNVTETELNRLQKKLDKEIMQYRYKIERLEKQLNENAENNKKKKHVTYESGNTAESGQKDKTVKITFSSATVSSLHEFAVEEAGNDYADFPYRTKLNVILYGGSDKFRKKFCERFPNIRLAKMSNHIDINPVRNMDLVIFQTNFMNHPDYYKIRDFCQKNNITYHHMANDNKTDFQELLNKIKELEQL